MGRETARRPRSRFPSVISFLRASWVTGSPRLIMLRGMGAERDKTAGDGEKDTDHGPEAFPPPWIKIDIGRAPTHYEFTGR